MAWRAYPYPLCTTPTVRSSGAVGCRRAQSWTALRHAVTVVPRYIDD